MRSDGPDGSPYDGGIIAVETLPLQFDRSLSPRVVESISALKCRNVASSQEKFGFEIPVFEVAVRAAQLQNMANHGQKILAAVRVDWRAAASAQNANRLPENGLNLSIFRCPFSRVCNFRWVLLQEQGAKLAQIVPECAGSRRS